MPTIVFSSGKAQIMITHADKTQKNKSRSVANSIFHKQPNGGASFLFVDNRPEAVAQRKLQGTTNNNPQAKRTSQLRAMLNNHVIQKQQPIPRKENRTGLPDSLKTGLENLSGYSMDDVKVHYNSSKPAQINAHAYAQGTDIHLGPGHEKHLPHESWHVVQQKQGRVKPTMQMKGSVKVNDDLRLEKEADIMGAKSVQMHNLDKSELKLPIQAFTVGVTPYSAWAVAQLNGEGLGFQGTVAHYIKKIPDLADLLTSHRRQKMLFTTTLARQIASSIGPKYVQAEKIKLVHANDNSKGSKTDKRRLALIKEYEGKQAPTKISTIILNKVMPSVDEMQVATASGKYISLQGVGRISAVKLAFPNSKIEVELYTLQKPLIKALHNISESYEHEESVFGKGAGALTTITLGTLGYYAAPYVAASAASTYNYLKGLFSN